jgi:hypothetical protein
MNQKLKNEKSTFLCLQGLRLPSFKKSESKKSQYFSRCVALLSFPTGVEKTSLDLRIYYRTFRGLGLTILTPLFITGCATLCHLCSPLFCVLINFSTYVRTPRTSDRPLARPLPAHNNTTHRDQGQTSIPKR